MWDGRGKGDTRGTSCGNWERQERKRGRETPEVTSDLFFSEQETEVLKLIKYRGEYAANKGKSLSLRDAILIIATLGGFVKGKGREPGVKVMWRGIQRLADILIGVSLTMGIPQSDYG